MGSEWLVRSMHRLVEVMWRLDNQSPGRRHCHRLYEKVIWLIIFRFRWTIFSCWKFSAWHSIKMFYGNENDSHYEIYEFFISFLKLIIVINNLSENKRGSRENVKQTTNYNPISIFFNQSCLNFEILLILHFLCNFYNVSTTTKYTPTEHPRETIQKSILNR